MKTSFLLAVLAPLSLLGCLTRAPTTHELDRRAGLLPADRTETLAQVHTSSAVARSPMAPVRLPPLVEKVWVSDLPLGPDARLQGTWLYLEVDRGRWLDEVDPGGAPLLDLERPPTRPVAPSLPAGDGRSP
jgi:hypothetical protein